jgi:hypothetical protein
VERETGLKANTTATDHQEPHPHPNPPSRGRGFYGVFALHGGDFMGLSNFHGGFSNPSPFPLRLRDSAASKGEACPERSRKGRRGMGYICRCSTKKLNSSYL